ncbi:MAG: endonuclease Q family protein [Syntrophorhabdales bacterium]|jgi:uncharacterized protein (TIGR00375 family)
MSFIADLHIHSRYSRATSRQMVPEAIWRWAQLKGITVVGTGDFTHPGWYDDLARTLYPAGNGLFMLREELRTGPAVPVTCRSDVFFLLSVEISCIYKKEGRTRKVHCLILVPDMAAASRLNRALGRIGNITSDGRPILGLDAEELLRITLDITPDAVLIPAHAWTPHFSVFGAASGFDSLEECFGGLAGHIHALETGLSSDPPMNWRIPALDGLNLVSNSDAHSPAKMGREATVFDTDISYRAITEAITTRRGLAGTIEFFPEEGKYHYDGHRTCGVVYSPDETKGHDYLCPSCGKRLTIGVAHRVEVLSGREYGYRPPGVLPFRSAIPLAEIISEVLHVGPATKTVQDAYMRLLAAVGNEFTVLLDAPLADIRAGSPPLTAEAIERVRRGAVHIRPGYDGEYGRIRIFDDDQKGRAPVGQGTLPGTVDSGK